jgi:hypothetical protein
MRVQGSANDERQPQQSCATPSHQGRVDPRSAAGWGLLLPANTRQSTTRLTSSMLGTLRSSRLLATSIEMRMSATADMRKGGRSPTISRRARTTAHDEPLSSQGPVQLRDRQRYRRDYS